MDCFEPALLGINDPHWLSDFELFIEELETNFGTFNPEGEAKAKLEQLRMHENHQAMKYFIKFQHISPCVRWGNAALHQKAYNGLAKCIKNDMVHHGKPNTLIGLCGLAQAINTHYWECKAKIAQETGNPGSSSMKPNSKPNPKPDSCPGNTLSQSKNNSGSIQNKGSTSEQKKSTPNTPPKLSKDGKLTPQDHQHCMDNKLCHFCGTAGHITKDCVKAASSKACTVKTKQENPEFSTTAPKKDKTVTWTLHNLSIALISPVRNSLFSMHPLP